MCSEVFLALIYFLVIFTINFFLYKILTFYIKNILKLQKLKNINKIYPNNKLIGTLYKYSNTEIRNLETLNNLENKNTQEIDTLIIGNIYKYLKNVVKKTQNKNSVEEYYFDLLANQYLSINFNLE
jgi:hypothetical protein